MEYERRYFRRVMFIGTTIAILVILLLASGCAHTDSIPECEELMPLDSPATLADKRPEEIYEGKKLDFVNKSRIGYGKYGFRRKIDIMEKTIISQEVIEDLQLKNIVYGIYKDSLLNKPVAEVNMADNLKASQAIEMGAPFDEYPYYAPQLNIVLESGTYYLAVYSTDPNEKNTALYESRKAVVHTEIPLEEGKWGFFFSTGKDQKTYFKINVKKPGSINVERDFWKFTYKIRLCNADKEPVAEAVLIPAEPGKQRQKAQITVPDAGTYYLQVSTDNPDPSCWAYELRYQISNS